MECARLTRYGLLTVTGADARDFLHAQLTSDIAQLGADRAALAGWCTAKGRLLATMLVFRSGDQFFLQLSRDIAPAVAKPALFRYHRSLAEQRALVTHPLQPRLVAEALLLGYRDLFA